MNKNFIIALIIIGVMCTSVVSAGFFDWMTGKVTVTAEPKLTLWQKLGLAKKPIAPTVPTSCYTAEDVSACKAAGRVCAGENGLACITAPTTAKPGTETTAAEPSEFYMIVGESINFGGKTVMLKSVSALPDLSQPEVRVNVGGTIDNVKSTPKKINSIQVELMSVQIQENPKVRAAVLKLKRLSTSSGQQTSGGVAQPEVSQEEEAAVPADSCTFVLPLAENKGKNEQEVCKSIGRRCVLVKRVS